MCYLSLKPETVIVNNIVIKISSFKLIPHHNMICINDRYYYIFPFKKGPTLDTLPISSIVVEYVDFLFNTGKIINQQLFLPYDDICNLSNFVYNNGIQPIDLIDSWWCCYGFVSKMDIVNCLLTNEIKIKYIYKIGYSTLWTQLK